MSGTDRLRNLSFICACIGILGLFARAAFAQTQQQDTTTYRSPTTLPGSASGPQIRTRDARNLGPSPIAVRNPDGTWQQVSYQRPRQAASIQFRVPLDGWHSPKGMDIKIGGKIAGNNTEFSVHAWGSRTDPLIDADKRWNLRIGSTRIEEAFHYLKEVGPSLGRLDVLTAIDRGIAVEKEIKAEKRAEQIEIGEQIIEKVRQSRDSLCVVCLKKDAASPTIATPGQTADLDRALSRATRAPHSAHPDTVAKPNPAPRPSPPAQNPPPSKDE